MTFKPFNTKACESLSSRFCGGGALIYGRWVMSEQRKPPGEAGAYGAGFLAIAKLSAEV